MTVCVAAISQEGVIFGAADRMLTSGDVEFESPRQFRAGMGKIIPLTNSIAAMFAGDTSLQTDILFNHIQPAISDWLSANPTKWLPVREAVDIYIRSYNAVRRNRAEQRILIPIGLTYETFLAQQKEMDGPFVESIWRALSKFNLERVETIITGTEPAHGEGAFYSRLYSIYDNEPVCCDMLGFAAVGSGSRHAESQFMLAGYVRNAPTAETLLLTYTAKKKSEVAPGVGKETDVFVIAGAGMLSPLKPDVVERTDAIYRKLVEQQAEVLLKANLEVTQYIAAVTKAPDKPPQNPPETPAPTK